LQALQACNSRKPCSDYTAGVIDCHNIAPQGGQLLKGFSMKKTAFAALGIATVAIAGALVSGQVAAQSTPDAAIKYRQAAFTLMGNHMGRLGAMAKGNAPFDAKAAQASANVVAMVSHLPWDAFPKGSEGANSKVKGDPWTNADEFKKLGEKMMAETAKLPAAAASLDTLKTQVGAVGASCKGCHDKFKAK
jgi:cytochrome c556